MPQSLDVLLHAIIKSHGGLLIPYSKDQHSTVNVKEWLLKQKPSPYQFAEESGADKVKQWELQRMPASRRVHLRETANSSGINLCKSKTMQLECVCCTRRSKHSGDFLFSCLYLTSVTLQSIYEFSRGAEATAHKGLHDELTISPESASLFSVCCPAAVCLSAVRWLSVYLHPASCCTIGPPPAHIQISG